MAQQTDENGKPLTYWGGVAKPDVEKLSEEVYGKGVKEDYEEGYVDGYNKAKETLYTEEQVRDAMEFARGYSKMTDTVFIKLLKNK